MKSTPRLVQVLSIAALGSVPACSDVPGLGGGGWQYERIDEGALCLYAQAPEVPHTNGPAQLYEADQALFVTVTLGCLSACIQDEQASCSVHREQDTLVVNSVHTYDPPPAHTGCIALCHALSATCSTEPLPAGQYQLQHGDHVVALSIPSSVEKPCL